MTASGKSKAFDGYWFGRKGLGLTFEQQQLVRRARDQALAHSKICADCGETYGADYLESCPRQAASLRRHDGPA